MYFVYLLKSYNKDWFYVGLTENTQNRLNQHNSGRVKSTKYYRPFKLVFTKSFENRPKARDFEKYLKIRSNKEKLIKSL